MSREHLRAVRSDLQIVFQDPMASLDPRMRVRDLIAEGMNSFGIGKDNEDRTRRVGELLERVQLDPELMWSYAHEFSGGQRQRLCIARALAVEPRLIICDEAVSALDVSIQAQILNLLSDLQRDLGLAYLFITHDLSVVRFLADRVVVMYLGRVVEDGPTAQIFENPQHPYTRALLAAAPSVDPAHQHSAPPILGDVPSPSNPPSGCHFHTRCPVALARCASEVPSWVEHRSDHGARCFLTEPAT